MARRPQQSMDFKDVAEALLETNPGQEASMYGHLRDLFIHFLGYAGRQVVIDTAGDAGRPDLTCRAPSGLVGTNGRPHEIDWIVLEAKDQRSGLSIEENRERIFAEKSKYITPNTAWFVMADPIMFTARPRPVRRLRFRQRHHLLVQDRNRTGLPTQIRWPAGRDRRRSGQTAAFP